MPDRSPKDIDLTRLDRDGMIAVHRALWGGFYRCPTTGKILECLPNDDKVICRCGISNTINPAERTERTGTHATRWLAKMTVADYVDQQIHDWTVRAAK